MSPPDESRAEPAAALISFTEQFYEHFPFYLAIGMTPAEFWNGDVCLARYYRKAHELKRQERNQEMWMQGMYFYDAVCRASPILRSFAKNGTKPVPYLNEPYPLSYKELRQKEENEEKARYEKNIGKFSAWANAINAVRKEGKNDG